jgi:hypothetical protein
MGPLSRDVARKGNVGWMGFVGATVWKLGFGLFYESMEG